MLVSSIDLDGMSKALAETGKVEREGVLFDTVKASLKAESAEVVATICSCTLGTGWCGPREPGDE
ncbi:hypothetical protein [Marinobacterium weihaiense]|nr:hypothetical protein [Marinobacterium weihaiense]